MNKSDLVSDEQLNALVDNELDTKECTQVLSAIDKDPLLQQRRNDLLRLKYLLAKSYHDIPQPKHLNSATICPTFRVLVGAASAALILLGMFLGWFIHANLNETPDLPIESIEQFDSVRFDGEKILLHINTDDRERVRAALQLAESLLQDGRAKQTHLKLEIVANADGLNILRAGSPYANEIAELANEYQNIEFFACGVAKQNAKLKEGTGVKLIPQAKDIPAALDEILTRLQDGWTYLRG